jgi:pantoate--beta-alanine ligase
VRCYDRIAPLRDALAELRAAGARIGFVPTMGSLHEGHLALCDVARATCDTVVMSIFVNPLQFGPGEDLDRYPRDLERDHELAAARAVDVLFAPGTAEMYPRGAPALRLVAPGMTERLCGAFRPGHFEGVLTVVAKLFNIIGPDVAVFGRKDLQQAALIRRMVADLDMPVRIEVAPIVREADGLAMSSRNVYLGPADRRAARSLSRSLYAAQAAFAAGERDPATLVAAAREILEAEPGVSVQYVELVDPETLDTPDRARAGDAVAVAAYAGATRLIDNHLLH